MKKKLLTMVLITALALSATACSKGDAVDGSTMASSEVASGAEEGTAEGARENAEFPAEVVIAGKTYSTDETNLYIAGWETPLTDADLENLRTW